MKDKKLKSNEVKLMAYLERQRDAKTTDVTIYSPGKKIKNRSNLTGPNGSNKFSNTGKVNKIELHKYN